ncbi:MAG TPA: orotidine-5'-phosphate decarboxylase [Oligoflexia bacterium]|nr:orotidine-5'-phosphate decarboxylase [Oligoflexia bacterium]HMP47700.1 orotidine-5'-phosphate decarboxylase [Oligoflexia bacterium]
MNIDINFTNKISRASKINKSYLCVGLDPEFDRLPDVFKNKEKPFLEFNKCIINLTADLVCAYKPQIAHYSALSKEEELLETIRFIKSTYPEIPVILDAKRGDIGSTARHYAVECFDRYGADAVTLNPYLGFDAIEPFLEWKGKGLIILCKTSNPGSSMLQDLKCPNKELYLEVARQVDSWQDKGDFLLVVGATYPDIMKQIREIAKNTWFLVPGIGAQGGDLHSVVSSGRNSDFGLIISSSRGIIHKTKGSDFEQVVRAEALSIRDQINQLL